MKGAGDGALHRVSPFRTTPDHPRTTPDHRGGASHSLGVGKQGLVAHLGWDGIGWMVGWRFG